MYNRKRKTNKHITNNFQMYTVSNENSNVYLDIILQVNVM